MKKAFIVLAGCLLAVLILPAIIQPPAVGRAEHEGVVITGAKLIESLNEYHAEFDEVPLGGHAAIVKALRGDNPKKTVFFECADTALNAKGELLDPWGTPFHINFEPETLAPRIHSAGADRIFESEHSKHSDDYRSWHHPN